VALEVSFSSTLKKNLLVCEQVGYKSWKCKGGGKGGGGECVNTNLYIYIERERERVSQLLKWSSWSWMHKMHVVCSVKKFVHICTQFEELCDGV
jgi:hypothetical protein